MNYEIRSKVALITGGASGIGRATALEFAKQGVHVVIQDIEPKGAERTVDEIIDLGGDACYISGDVSSSNDASDAVKYTVTRYGQLDFAFNNAANAFNNPAKLHETEEEVWDRMISVLLKGVWLGMKYQITQMLKNDGGVIINTSSIMGLVGGLNGTSPYIAAKHGVLGLSKTAALEYATRKIRVNAVCPAVIRTRRLERVLFTDPGYLDKETLKIPMGRIGEDHEVAKAVVWLCSSSASFITGHALPIDGGYLIQ